MKRRKKSLNINKNYLDNIYIPKTGLKTSERDDGVIVIDLENKGLFNRIAQKFFHKPKISHIALDNHGSVLWKALDGKKTVYEIVKVLEESFPQERDRMFDRVIYFFKLLEHYQFIELI